MNSFLKAAEISKGNPWLIPWVFYTDKKIQFIKIKNTYYIWENKFETY